MLFLFLTGHQSVLHYYVNCFPSKSLSIFYEDLPFKMSNSLLHEHIQSQIVKAGRKAGLSQYTLPEELNLDYKTGTELKC